MDELNVFRAQNHMEANRRIHPEICLLFGPWVVPPAGEVQFMQDAVDKCQKLNYASASRRHVEALITRSGKLTVKAHCAGRVKLLGCDRDVDFQVWRRIRKQPADLSRSAV